MSCSNNLHNIGLACLNYTKADTIAHHQKFAKQNNLPPPCRGIFYGGVACVIVGSGLGGYLLGSRNRSIPIH
jgi:hypothetical protein